MSNATVNDLIARARFAAAGKLPYLAKSLWAATFIACEDVPTLGIDDRWRVYFNPNYVKKCAEDSFSKQNLGGKLAGELIHEVMHPTFRHKSRGIAIHAEDHKHWNCCGDAEIDQQIEAAGVLLVDDRVRPEALGGERGMTAEELYRLPKKESPDRCAGGSGAGRPMPWEDKDLPKDAPEGLSTAEVDIVRAATANAIREHAKSHPGTVPLGILRWAEEFVEAPPVDWRALAA